MVETVRESETSNGYKSHASLMENVVEWVRRKQLIGSTNRKGLTDRDN